MGLLISTVTRFDCSAAAWRSTVTRWLGKTLLPSSDTTLPSTRTQPRAIHSSASRREHRPSSDMRLDRRNNSSVMVLGIYSINKDGDASWLYTLSASSKSVSSKIWLRALLSVGPSTRNTSSTRSPKVMILAVCKLTRYLVSTLAIEYSKPVRSLAATDSR